MDRIKLEIGGMSCHHCVHSVTQALEGVDGVEVERVDIGAATVRYDAARVTPEQLTDAIEDQGYEVIGAA